MLCCSSVVRYQSQFFIYLMRCLFSFHFESANKDDDGGDGDDDEDDGDDDDDDDFLT